MKTKTKILFAAGESAPFVTTGGLGEVVGSLPKYINAKNPDCDVRVVIPLYEEITAKFGERIKYAGYTYVDLNWRHQYCGVHTAEENGVTYYFIDNEYYFKRPKCYGHFDDGERFAFFGKAVLDILETIDFFPDIIHMHDWHAATAAIHLATSYQNKKIGAKAFKDIKTVFTIHNMEFQGEYDMPILEEIFDISFFHKDLVDFGGRINLMKGAIVCSDLVTTVSPGYAREIHTAEYAHGLESVINMETAKIRGILNGIDYGSYNPETDERVYVRYNAETLENKLKNKLALQVDVGLPQNGRIPLVAMITRITKQKGFDLMERVMHELGGMQMQLVIFGDGNRGEPYEGICERFAGLFPEKVRFLRGYNPDFARKLYAGADMILMPSEFEPCGLSQMIAARYGTVPLVSRTGGLADTITPYGEPGEGIGFVFGKHDKDSMLHAIGSACALYGDEKKWRELVRRCMGRDFGWQLSAGEYIKMYGELWKQKKNCSKQ